MAFQSCVDRQAKSAWLDQRQVQCWRRVENRTLPSAWPYVVSIDRTTPAGPITNAAAVNYTVTFSEAVTGVNSSDFQVVTSGSVMGTLTQVTPVSSSVYTVTVSGITGNGTLGLNLVDNGSIQDLAGDGLTQQNASAAFQPQQTFATGKQPFSVALGDLTGDGKLDLVTANDAQPTVSVLLANGNGTFHAQQTFAAAAGPLSVAVGDVNGDAIPDLVTANGSYGSVSVLLGNGDGTFQAPQAFAAGQGAFFVVLGDLTGDGKSDIVVGDEQENAVSVLLGNGNGTFQAQHSFATPGAHPEWVALGDVNGDGIPDLTVADYGTSTVGVLLGNGNGTFQAQKTFVVGTNPASLALADLTGDGKLDVVATNRGTFNTTALDYQRSSLLLTR